MSADLEEMLEHLKWNLWHGKVDRASEILDELAYALDIEEAVLQETRKNQGLRGGE